MMFRILKRSCLSDKNTPRLSDHDTISLNGNEKYKIYKLFPDTNKLHEWLDYTDIMNKINHLEKLSPRNFTRDFCKECFFFEKKISFTL